MEYDLRGWVDLGLPSGKLWATKNEEGYFTFDEAVEKFQDQLPTADDWNELLNNTDYFFDEIHDRLIVEAPNGEKLYLPVTGYRDGTGLCRATCDGNYWSATPDDDEYDQGVVAWGLYFDFDYTETGMESIARRCGLAVRLIKAK